jgi:hypothetical protein
VTRRAQIIAGKIEDEPLHMRLDKSLPQVPRLCLWPVFESRFFFWRCRGASLCRLPHADLPCNNRQERGLQTLCPFVHWTFLSPSLCCTREKKPRAGNGVAGG